MQIERVVQIFYVAKTFCPHTPSVLNEQSVPNDYKKCTLGCALSQLVGSIRRGDLACEMDELIQNLINDILIILLNCVDCVITDTLNMIDLVLAEASNSNVCSQTIGETPGT